MTAFTWEERKPATITMVCFPFPKKNVPMPQVNSTFFMSKAVLLFCTIKGNKNVESVSESRAVTSGKVFW